MRCLDVSVIVPVRNGAATLPEVLAALAALDPAPRELIVVDDASTDESASLARAAGARVVETAGGPAVARNAGARAALGSLLLFVDADVVVRPDALGRIAETLAAVPGLAGVQGVYGTEDRYPTAWTLYQQAYYHHYFSKVSRRTEAVVATYCTALRKDAFERAGGFDEEVTQPTIEDERLGYAMFDLGYRVRLVPELEVDHRVRYTAASFVRRRYRIVLGQSRMLREDLRRVQNVLGRDGHHPRNVLAAVGLLPLALLATPFGLALPAVALVPWAAFVLCHAGFWTFVLRRWGPAALARVAGITLIDGVVILVAGVRGLMGEAAPVPRRAPACA